jgi:cell division protein ZapA (FtsZ GTPase activity inhibitor)
MLGCVCRKERKRNMKSLTEEDAAQLLSFGDFGEYAIEVIAEQEVEFDAVTTKLDAALREIRELHGELTNTRAQLAAVMELDSDVFTANARLGGCQQRVAELEAELAGCQTVGTGWPGR